MNPVNEFPMFDERPLDADGGDDFSVEDFLRQLEARERDLHISSDLDIEIEESGFDEVPDFIMQDLEAETRREIEVHPGASGDPVQTAELQRLEGQVANLQAELIRKEAARYETAEMLKRRQTDFENLKKRVERDKGEARLDNVSDLVNALLPVLDNIGRALEFAGPIVADRSEEFRRFYEGMVLVERQMKDALDAMGVEEIPAVGQVFDPCVHEAVAVEESREFAANAVMDELRRGYRVGERVIRAAMVKVASAPREEKFDVVCEEEVPDDEILDLGSESA